MKQSLSKQITGFIILSFTGSIIIAAIELVLFKLLKLETGNMRDYSLLLQLISIAFNILVYLFIWNCIYFIYHYIVSNRKEQITVFELQSQVKELEWKIKTEYTEPQFIFDSLDTIRSSMNENPKEARKSITELSKILRINMQAEKLIKKLINSFPSVHLQKELNKADLNSKNYMKESH